MVAAVTFHLPQNLGKTYLSFKEFVGCKAEAEFASVPSVKCRSIPTMSSEITAQGGRGADLVRARAARARTPSAARSGSHSS